MSDWQTVRTNSGGGCGNSGGQPPASTKAPPCRFFQIGTCTAGAQCKFSHDKTGVVKSSEVCTFWQQGRCVHGESCAFRHSTGKQLAGSASSKHTKAVGYIPPPPPPPPPQAAPAPPSWMPVSISDANAVAAMEPAARRQQLGTLVYPRIVPLLGEPLAKKLTGMLLTMPPAQLLSLLTSTAPAPFEAAVRKALGALPAEMLQRLSIGGSGRTGASEGGGGIGGGNASCGSRCGSSTQPLSMAPAGFAGAIPPLPRPHRTDPASEQAVRAIAPTAAEIAHSSALSCGICLEPIIAKRGKFGLLEGCNHVFCDACLRQWRSTHATRPDVARSCPECRAPSHFVVPSSVHVDGPRKAQLVKAYLSRLRAIPCKHFAYGEGTCPFGTSCFFAHTDREGKPIAIGQPRAAIGKGGSTVLPNYLLSDYLFPESSPAIAGEALLASIPIVDAPRANTRNLEEAGEGNDGEDRGPNGGGTRATDGVCDEHAQDEHMALPSPGSAASFGFSGPAPRELS